VEIVLCRLANPGFLIGGDAEGGAVIVELRRQDGRKSGVHAVRELQQVDGQQREKLKIHVKAFLMRIEYKSKSKGPFACQSFSLKCDVPMLCASFHKTGLPDGIFSNKNPNLGKFWRVLQ
jgi:hypothetical protein